MLIVAVIITWIIGAMMIKNRKNLADIWFSVTFLLLGLGLLILFNATMMGYYQEIFSISTYNKICLLHSIISGILEFLTRLYFLYPSLNTPAFYRKNPKQLGQLFMQLSFFHGCPYFSFFLPTFILITLKIPRDFGI